MASAVTKLSTGLTGMAVAKHPHQTLKVLYDKTLRTLAKMPNDARYRQHTEAVVNHRLQLVNAEPDVQKLTEKINCGLIEEVILQAQRELSLSRKFLQWQPWQSLVEDAPSNQWKWPVGNK